MFRKTFSSGIHVLLLVSLLLFCLTKIQCQEEPETAEEEQDPAEKSTRVAAGSTTRSTNNPTMLTNSQNYDNEYLSEYSEDPDGKKGSKGYNDKKWNKDYGQDIIGDYSGNRGRGRYDDNYESGPSNKGIDPDTYGQDFADRKDIYEDKDLMVGSIHVWIKNADRWDEPDRYPYRPNQKKNYRKPSKKYSKDKDYKGKDKNYKGKNSDEDDDYNKGKGKYEKVTFPVRAYKSYKKFPRKRLPPLFSALPWTPIFYDKLTYQTFIYCPTGHFLILPPLINFFGQRFAVAQLIKWGYASLVSSGVAPGPGFNAAPLVQPAGGPGAPPPPSVPYNAQSGQYNGGVTTNYGSFKPRNY